VQRGNQAAIAKQPPKPKGAGGRTKTDPRLQAEQERLDLLMDLKAEQDAADEYAREQASLKIQAEIAEAGGDTDDEAIVNLARKLNLRLWNES
jgi:hypothetical protein